MYKGIQLPLHNIVFWTARQIGKNLFCFVFSKKCCLHSVFGFLRGITGHKFWCALGKPLGPNMKYDNKFDIKEAHGTISGLRTIRNTTTNSNVLLLHKQEESLVFLESIGKQSEDLASDLEVLKVFSDQIFSSNVISLNKDLCF